MLGQSTAKPVTAAMSASATVSNYVDVRGANHVTIELPTMSTYFASAAIKVYVQGANDPTSTFRRMFIDGSEWNITTTGNVQVFCDPGAVINYLKIETDVSCTAAVGIQVHKHH